MQLSCEEVIRALSSYLDDEVTAQRRSELQEHLAMCRHCTAIVDGSRNVVRLIAEARTFEVPITFRQHLFDRIDGSGT